jgi:hypothetical protein
VIEETERKNNKAENIYIEKIHECLNKLIAISQNYVLDTLLNYSDAQINEMGIEIENLKTEKVYEN